MDLTPTALFSRFFKPLPVRWSPLGFPVGPNAGTRYNSFEFTIHSDADYTPGDKCSLDVKAGGVDFDVHFDSKLSADPIQALDEAAWQAICSGPFAGRQFFAEPRDMETAFESVNDETFNRIPVRFAHTGEPIPGLKLAESIAAASWSFFIPKPSVAFTAITLARSIASAHRRGYRSEGERKMDLLRLTGQLEATLATA